MKLIKFLVGILILGALVGCSNLKNDTGIQQDAYNDAALEQTQNAVTQTLDATTSLPTLTPSPDNNTDETMEVENYKLQIEYNDIVYNGLYSGGLLGGLANGSGRFSSEDSESYLVYTGSWIDNMFSSSGYLKTNNYILRTTDNEIQLGTFEGETENGKASGSGTWTAIDSNGDSYTYTGEWANGLWNGKGTKAFDDPSSPTVEGTFTDCIFTPTPCELFVFFEQTTGYGYNISENAETFLNDHVELFTNNSEQGLGAYVDTTFSYRAFAKNPEKFGDKLIRLTLLRVDQIFEYDIYDNGSLILTEILATDADMNVFYVYYIGEVIGVYAGDKITMYALPMDYFTFETSERKDMWAIACAAAYVK